MTVSALGSAFVENVIFVAAFIPVVQVLVVRAGNITIIGSTANILALEMLEKRHRTRMVFLEWFRVDFATGFIAILVSWLALMMITLPMFGG